MSPGRRGTSAGSSSGRRPTARTPGSIPGSVAISGLEQLRSGVERPPELRLLAGDDAEDLVASRRDVRVRLAHDVDDDRRRLGHERLAPPEQATVPHRPTEELAQDVAAPLVRGQHVVGDEERDCTRMVGDDLVAEALALEGVRVVTEELAHPGVDRGEQVGVVVGRDLLEDARQALETEPGVDARERQRDPTVGLLVELHEHEVPDLEPARAVLAVIRDAVRVLRTGGRRDRSGSRCTARTDRCRPSARSCCRRRCRRRPRRAIRSGGRPISSRQTCARDLVVLVCRRGKSFARDAQVAGQEVPGKEDRIALEVVAERPVAEHLEERVVARRSADLLEVVVLAGDAQAALVVDRALVRARLGTDQDVLELDHPRVREQQRRVPRRHKAGAGHDRVTAFGEELDEAAADLGGGQRDDPRIFGRDGGRHGRNGTQRTCQAAAMSPTCALDAHVPPSPISSTGPIRSGGSGDDRSQEV